MSIFEEYYYIWAVFIAMPFLVWFIIKSVRTANLASKFAKIGDMSGMTLTQIQTFVGRPPSDIRKKKTEDGMITVATWSSPGYTIAIVFDAKEVFNNIASESAN